MKLWFALLVCVAQARFLQPDAVPTTPQLHKPFILDDEGAPENLAAITQILSKEPAAASSIRGDIPAMDAVNGVTSNDELLDRVGGLGPLANGAAPPAGEVEGEDDDLSGNPELVEEKTAADPEAEGLEGEAAPPAAEAAAEAGAEAAAAEGEENFETQEEFAEEQKIKRYQELVDHATQIMQLVPKTKERLAELIKKRDEWRAEKIVTAAQKKLNRQTELRAEVEQKLEELKSQQADLEALRERLDKTMAKLQNVITNKGKLVEVGEEETSDDDKPEAEVPEGGEEAAKADTAAAEETAEAAEAKEKAKDDEEDDKDGDDDDKDDKDEEKEDPDAVTHAVELELSQLKKKHHAH